MIAKNINLIYTYEGDLQLHLTVDRNKQLINKVAELKKTVEKGKMLDFEVKPYRKKRSLDANAMMWSILAEIANVLKTSKDEVYLNMLDRYGIFTHIVVKPEVVDKVKKEWRITRELGEIEVNGKKGIQLQCYFGSSTYNTKEFSHLLEGVIYEAKELGIETMTDREKELLIAQWKGDGS